MAVWRRAVDGRTSDQATISPWPKLAYLADTANVRACMNRCSSFAPFLRSAGRSCRVSAEERQ